MIFFDYTFYRVAEYYFKTWNDSRGAIYGITLVALLQLSYIWIALSIGALFSTQINFYLFQKWESSDFLNSWIIYPCFIIYGLNLLRYLYFVKYEMLQIKWQLESKSSKSKKGIIVTSIVILSLASAIILSIYRSNN
jgi:hypothetical protein